MSELIVQDKLSSQIAAIAVHYNVIEFVNGQQDCRDGVKHADGKGDSYDAGFRTQYEIEQQQSTGAN